MHALYYDGVIFTLLYTIISFSCGAGNGVII